MDLGLILRVAGIGMLVGVLVMLLNESGRKEQGTLVILAGVVVVLYMVMQSISQLFGMVQNVFKLY